MEPSNDAPFPMTRRPAGSGQQRLSSLLEEHKSSFPLPNACANRYLPHTHVFTPAPSLHSNESQRLKSWRARRFHKDPVFQVSPSLSRLSLSRGRGVSAIGVWSFDRGIPAELSARSPAFLGFSAAEPQQDVARPIVFSRTCEAKLQALFHVLLHVQEWADGTCSDTSGSVSVRHISTSISAQ